MAYFQNESRQVRKSKQKSLGTSSSNAQRSSQHKFYELEPAEVVDVIRTPDHPAHDTFEDVGKAKVRKVHSDFNQTKDSLVWASPIEPNRRAYPMKHEVVVIAKYLGNYFYTHRINFLSNINHNEDTWISINYQKHKKKNKSRNYEKRAAGSTRNQNIEPDPPLGDIFVRDDENKPLIHEEGDVVLEGRFGNSIRFGSNQNTHNPLIKIRCGQYPEADNKDYLEPIFEDLNKDASSIYLTEDEPLDLKPATRDMSSHYFSVKYSDDKPPPDPAKKDNKWEGKQIIENSDRIVLNTKVNQLVTFSKDSTHMLSNEDFTKDIERDYISKVVRDRYHETDRDFTRLTKGNYKDLTRGHRRIYVNAEEYHAAGDSFVVEVPQSFLFTGGGTFANSSGSEDRNSGKEPPTVPSSPGFDTEEPHALGWSLADFLRRMIVWIDQHTHPSPVGPTGPPPPTSPGGPLKGYMPGATNQDIDRQINSDNHWLQR